MQIIKEKLDIDEVLEKRIKNTLKQINFRKTFIEEYANLFNKGAINRFQDISVNGEIMQVEV